MTTTTQQPKSYYFEVPFEIKGSPARVMEAARQDAQDCADLNPGATVDWIWHGSFYWHGAYVVRVP
jgi:hypothetical protein